MNGPHDLGGRMGFGPLPLEADEPIFHADWEARALGITLTPLAETLQKLVQDGAGVA